jgi:cold shock CspA family protein
MATNGKMLWFNPAKGRGLIRTEENERLHVAETGFQPGEVPQGRCAGREVAFDFSVRDGERQAVNVRFLPEVDSRRARMRQGNRRR